MLCLELPNADMDIIILAAHRGEIKMIKPIITDFDINWMKIKSACMTTISKQAGSKEPPKTWKRKLLMCQHSPLRRGSISWKWEEIPYCISTHFVRHHVGCEKWIGTSRADRTEIKDRMVYGMDALKEVIKSSKVVIILLAITIILSIFVIAPEFVSELVALICALFANVPEIVMSF